MRQVLSLALPRSPVPRYITGALMHAAADAAGVIKPCDQEGDPMNKTSHPAPWHRRLAAAALALAGLLGAVTAYAATAQASQSAYPAATTGAMTVHTIHLVAHEEQRKFFNHGGSATRKSSGGSWTTPRAPPG